MTTEQKQVAGVAIASMILGILGFVLLGPIAAIPAVICGHIANSKIKKNSDTLTGGGMALAGLIMGYIQIGFMLLIIPLMLAIAIPSFVKAKTVSQKNACINNMRQIDSAKEQWALSARKETGDAADVTNISEYLRVTPKCPSGGEYEYNTIGEEPECSEHGSLDY